MNCARWFLFGILLLIGLMYSQTVIAQNTELTGLVTVDEIIENDSIFEIYINRYQPDEKALEYLKGFQDSVHVLVFFGSWCRESKKYVPGLVKTLQKADNKRIQLTYLGVDVRKKIPQEFLNKYQIEYIPTVVVLKGNTELGRIVEEPHERIETDLVEILKKAPLKK